MTRTSLLVLALVCLCDAGGGAPRSGRWKARPVAPQLRPYVALGHTEPLTVMAWSPDGQVLATGSSDHTVVLWEADGWKPRATLAGHRSPVISLVWSRDGRMLASSDADHRTIVWDAATGTPRLTLAGDLQPLLYSSDFLFALREDQWQVPPLIWPNPETLVTYFQGRSALFWDVTTGRRRAAVRLPGYDFMGVTAVSPDGRTLAIANNQEKENIVLWDEATGGRRLGFAAGDSVNALLWSPDSRTLAVAQGERLGLWDALTGRRRVELEGETVQLGGATLAWSADGRKLAGVVPGSPFRVALWDARTGRRERVLLGRKDLDLPTALAWSPDGTLLCVCYLSQAVLWDVQRGTPRGQPYDVRAPLAWSPDGRMLATGPMYVNDYTAIIWNGSTGRPQCYLAPRLNPVPKDGVTWSADGRTVRVAVQSPRGGTGVIWDAASGRAIAAFFDNGAADLRWSPDGRTLAVGGGRYQTLLWDRQTQETRFLPSSTGQRVEWSPDGRLLATPWGYSGVQIWDPAAVRDLAVLPGSTGGPFGDVYINYWWAPSWSPDGQMIAAAGSGGDMTVALLDVATRRARATLRGHLKRINAIAWSPSGKEIATAAYDGTVIVWESATGARLQTLSPPMSGPWVWLREWVLAWAPDGRSLATAVSGSGNAWLWSIDDGRLRAIIPTGASGIDALAWSPNGSVLAVAAKDHTIRLWDQQSRRFRAVLRGHTGTVTALRWSPDGRRLASGAADGSVRLWNTGTGRELAAFYSFDEGKQWLTVTPEGYFVASERGADVLRYRRQTLIWPVAEWRHSFERPDLVRRVLAGEPVPVGVERAQSVRS